ncbi:MAG TPA: PQQ-binding-like beta-propeller repeat protein [Candidatus Binatia bacterium]|nr:PQQ-binding-like beta-propeller repeat protein [Candidatus Binatia bacterium]
MDRCRGGWALTALLVLAAACSGGGGNPTCSNEGGVAPGGGAWPVSRHDPQNSGRIDAQISGSVPAVKWVFPTDGAKGSFITAPALSADGTRLYVGSLDAVLYALNTATGELDSTFSDNFFAAFPSPTTRITGAPGIDSSGKIFVGTEATLLAFNADGSLYRTVSMGGITTAITFAFNVTTQPVLNGTLYLGTETTASTGFLPAVCANGISRWTFGADPVASPPAIGPDGTIYFASVSSLHPFLRAIDPIHARVQWTFGAAAPIAAPPVLEVDDTTSPPTLRAIYVASVAGQPENAGRLFAVDPTSGARINVPTGCDPSSTCDPTGAMCCAPFSFAVTTGSDVRAAPALDFPSPGDGRVHTVYVAGTDGILYAVDTDSGATRASFATAGAINSSPVVARDASGATTIIVASDDGNVYRLIDDGTVLTAAWQFEVPSQNGEPVPFGTASPAIGSDGTVYIGTSDGHVYAIASTS